MGHRPPKDTLGPTGGGGDGFLTNGSHKEQSAEWGELEIGGYYLWHGEGV